MPWGCWFPRAKERVMSQALEPDVAVVDGNGSDGDRVDEVDDDRRRAAVDELDDLDPVERSELLTAVRKARAGGYGLDPVELYHANAKNDLNDPAQAEIFNELSSVTEPPMLKEYPGTRRLALPADVPPLDMSLEEAILTRESRRDFVQTPISLAELGA